MLVLLGNNHKCITHPKKYRTKCAFSVREIKKENRKNGSVEMNPSECCLVEIEFISTSFVCLFVCLIGG